MDSLRIGKLLGLHEVPGCCFRLTEMTTRERQRHAIMPAQTSRPLPLAAGAYGGGLGDPEMRQLNPESPLDSATGRNDRLVEAIAKHPDRFSGFTVLPHRTTKRPLASSHAASLASASRAR